jgi:cytosine/adenosine deaminase-related metal-dependent hydrolase
MVVMPGLINPHCRHEMPGYVRNGVQGHLSVADEYVPAEIDYDDLLDAGYTALGLYPLGNGIPGRAIVVRIAGKPEDRVLLSPAYLEVSNNKKVFKDALQKAKQEIEKVEKARKEFEEKQKQAAASQPAGPPVSQPATQPASQPAFKPPEIDPAHQVLVDLIQKKEGLTALVEITRASDVVHMADVIKSFDLAPDAARFLLRYTFQTDLYRVEPELGPRKSKVVMTPWPTLVPNSVERLPIVQEYTAAGCEVTLIPINDSGNEHKRMFQRLATLVRDGWPRAAALKSVTLHPARLLGLDKRLGSIEKGKDADLILLDGDPLEPFARVRKVLIRGEIVHTVEGEIR